MPFEMNALQEEGAHRSCPVGTSLPGEQELLFASHSTSTLREKQPAAYR